MLASLSGVMSTSVAKSCLIIGTDDFVAMFFIFGNWPRVGPDPILIREVTGLATLSYCAYKSGVAAPLKSST